MRKPKNRIEESNIGIKLRSNYPAVASDPVLQCVSNLIGPSPMTPAKIALAPFVPIAILSSMSFCSIASVDCKNLQKKNRKFILNG